MVRYNGKPISGGVVVFEQKEDDPPPAGGPRGSAPLRATGRIEPDGTFRLMAFPGADGVPEGHYLVGISSIPPRTEANLFDSAGAIKKGNPDLLRGRYSDPQKSGLQTRVTRDQLNEPTFDLK
jgi:hypothetical protein